MAIELECDICGQEHRFRDEHAGRQTSCKECSARLQIPRDGLGGIIDGTTPVFTPPVLLIGGGLVAAVCTVFIWNAMSPSVPARGQPQVSTTTTPALPASPFSTAPSLPLEQPKVMPPATIPPVVTENKPVEPSIVPIQPRVPDRTDQPATILVERLPPKVIPQPEFPPGFSPQEIEARARQRAAAATPIQTRKTDPSQSVQIREISPTWAQPGERVTLRGTGLGKTTRVAAIRGGNGTQEFTLPIHAVSDTEVVVDAPPKMEYRETCFYLFEVHSPAGVAITFPTEIVDLDSGEKTFDFGITSRGQVLSFSAGFVLIDDLGQIRFPSYCRLYLLRPTKPLVFDGNYVTTVYSDPTPAPDKFSTSSAAGNKVIKVPEIFPCFLDRVFAGPMCTTKRLLKP